MTAGNPSQLVQTLSRATPEIGALLCWAIGTRLRHNYLTFASRCGWGSPPELDLGLRLLAAAADGAIPTRRELLDVEAACMQACPHSDDFADPSASQAIYSMAVVCYGLRFLASGDPANLVHACNNHLEAIAEYADSVAAEDEDFDNIGSGPSDARFIRESTLRDDIIREAFAARTPGRSSLADRLSLEPTPKPGELIWGPIQ